MLCYHVKWNQKGWVCALPHICFQIMNTVNASMKFSGFQLHLGCAPHVIPPIVAMDLLAELLDASKTAIERINNDVAEAQDNLLLTKISQSHYVDASWAPDPNYKIGNFIMLSTKHHQHEYK